MFANRCRRLTVRVLSLTACCLSFALSAHAQQVINGVQVFPSNSIFNTRIDSLPIDKNSSKYVNSLGATRLFHPDWGTDPSYGIPFNLVTGIPPTVPLINYPTFQYSDESDAGPYPTVTTALAIEGAAWDPNVNGGDRHCLMVDTTNGVLYELYSATVDGTTGDVSGGSGAIYNLNSNALRPDTWTSADAAGLPIFPLLVNLQEATAGPIKHAFRMTGNGANGHIWPARHSAGSVAGFPPFGQRFRLKKSFDVSKAPSNVSKNIVVAFQQYGLIYADNGSNWYVTGAPDPGWADIDLNYLKSLKGSDFEAVNESSLMASPDSGAVPRSFKPPGSVVNWPKVK